jgi:hypothetical protein
MSTEKQPLPFFVRYLENQAEDMSIEELNEVSGGSQIVTQRYPSDSDDVDSGYPTEKAKNPFDIDIDFPKFPSGFPFGNSTHYIK